MSSLDGVDPYAGPWGVDLSAIDADEVISVIGDRSQESSLRLRAIAAGVEIIAPKDGKDVRDETDERIVAALSALATSTSEEDRPLHYAAGDALGLAWIWHGELDRDTYMRMPSDARHGAARVLGADHGHWIEALDDAS